MLFWIDAGDINRPFSLAMQPRIEKVHTDDIESRTVLVNSVLGMPTALALDAPGGHLGRVDTCSRMKYNSKKWYLLHHSSLRKSI